MPPAAAELSLRMCSNMLRGGFMNDEAILTLHCPQCRQLVEVVVEGSNLVCLECGWKFDEKTAARFLQPVAPLEATDWVSQRH
jgi:hypothetical protein